MLLRGDVSVQDAPPLPDGYLVVKVAVSPRYFLRDGSSTQGREFNAADAAGAPNVAIVSEALARQIWPGQDAIGRRISIETHPAPGDWLTVVGIAGDIRQTGLTSPAVPVLYQPYQQVARPSFLTHMTFVARAEGDPRTIAPAMRGVLQAVYPHQPPQSLASMETIVAGTIA